VLEEAKPAFSIFHKAIRSQMANGKLEGVGEMHDRALAS
jgi:hypothetical protein